MSLKSSKDSQEGFPSTKFFVSGAYFRQTIVVQAFLGLLLVVGMMMGWDPTPWGTPWGRKTWKSVKLS